MKQMLTGPMQFTPYRPWSEERKAAARERKGYNQSATGLNAPHNSGERLPSGDAAVPVADTMSDGLKRVYCGPYLLALPPPKWWVGNVPTVPPYRIRVTRMSDGKEFSYTDFADQRNAMAKLWDLYVPSGSIAEVLDANDDWIMRVRADAAHPHI